MSVCVKTSVSLFLRSTCLECLLCAVQHKTTVYLKWGGVVGEVASVFASGKGASCTCTTNLDDVSLPEVQVKTCMGHLSI